MLEYYKTVEVGSNIVAGIKPHKILSATKSMLERADMKWNNPLGDGRSAKKIIDSLC
jgi:UDP-N-acetylglucosamine 2-epimerase